MKFGTELRNSVAFRGDFRFRVPGVGLEFKKIKTQRYGMLLWINIKTIFVLIK